MFSAGVWYAQLARSRRKMDQSPILFPPRKWDCPPCAAKGDRSMFSAGVWYAQRAFPPKNGPVPHPVALSPGLKRRDP